MHKLFVSLNADMSQVGYGYGYTTVKRAVKSMACAPPPLPSHRRPRRIPLMAHKRLSNGSLTALLTALLRPQLALVHVALWCCGEYGQLLKEPSPMDDSEGDATSHPAVQEMEVPTTATRILLYWDYYQNLTRILYTGTKL